MPRRFDPTAYGKEVEAILALDGHGERLMPLVCSGCSSAEAERLIRAATAHALFPSALSPEGALAGLWLYFSCFDESHSVAQDLNTPEGSYWHGILHRQEPDAGNAGYWFRHTGTHPVFALLRDAALEIIPEYPSVTTFNPKLKWDPFAFVDFCEEARRRPGSPEEKLALEIQRAEWQLLFDYCARGQA